ncbi:MAG: phage Tail Collar [Chthonomonadales bacterium]|nr:phage Tail Collar [Chthonomonadales bacterium]
MSQPFIGELRMFGFNYPPRGWAFANGQTMSISQNQALFALFGTTYGGNGVQTFLLPNLQGSTAMHVGPGYTQGQKAGSSSVTLNITQVPAHTHPFFVGANGGTKDPAGQAPATAGEAIYGKPGALNFDPIASTPAGGNQPHDNMQPYLVINWCVALVGTFPSRN